MKHILIIAIAFLIHQNIFSQVFFKTNAGAKGTPISKDLIGAFFEDINYGADGGLYAELVQNRSFEYYTINGQVSLQPLHAWTLVLNGGAKAEMQVENTNPLNSNNRNYLKLLVTNAGTEAGIRNSGFNGIPVSAGKKYRFSVYLRSESAFDHPVIVRLENQAGIDLGRDTIRKITTQWTKYNLEINCRQSDNLANLIITTNGAGTLFFDMVSLFPSNTFKNRENGLRNDLAQAIADLKPKFLRFPGGCITHGRGLANAYRWKETLGDVAERKPNWNLWGYHQTYGLGFFEFFQFCEDIGAKPLPVLPVGISCQFRTREIVPLSDMKPWIDDALDLIEFANGDVNSEWGRRRSEMGHPQPFNMEYICLGNEEDDIPEFRVRFKMIADSIRKHYPGIKIIGTSGTSASGNMYDNLWQYSRQEKVDAVDEHYYVDPSWLRNNIHRYDNFDRNGPKVFIGEWASRDDRLANALAEAAYLTGVEKNGDVVQFTCYAPLLCNEKNNQWNPDLIRFDNTKVVKTANYYVQQLYSVHSGDEYLNSLVTYEDGFDTNTTTYSGKIGVGTWNTQAEFDDITVTSGSKTLIQEDFSAGASKWQVISGTFSSSGGIYSQSSGGQPAWSIFNVPVDTSVYTFTLKARKTGGAEGFLIPFGFANAQNYYWLNIGGWNNTQHAVEKATGGSKTTLASKSGSVQNNLWYDIKIEVTKSSAKFYMNNELLFEIPAPAGPVAASVVKNIQSNELIIKMVNTGSSALTAHMEIEGIDTGPANVTSLTGLPDQRNSLTSPELVSPAESTLSVQKTFDYPLPAYSFQVFRIPLGNSSVSVTENEIQNSRSNIRIVPNPAEKAFELFFHNPDAENFTLYLIDASGRQVLRKEQIRDNHEMISSIGLKAGLYILKLRSKDETYSGKLLIK